MTMFSDEQLEHIALALQGEGYCILPNSLDSALLEGLSEHAKVREGFREAGVGRRDDHLSDKRVRSDTIAWIEGCNEVEGRWLREMEALKNYLNRRLYLGLFSFESHFAHYAPGAFYEKHRDAFRGEANRILSCVTYLNSSWQEDWGGELVVYSDDEQEVARVKPEGGTMVIFLSEEFPHEVLPATKDRLSIAGWFRVNNSAGSRVDPPR